MKRTTIILLSAAALLCSGKMYAQEAAAIADSASFSPYTVSALEPELSWQNGDISLFSRAVSISPEGKFFLAADTAAVADSLHALVAASYSPFAPKAEVYSDKDAPVKVSVKKEVKNGQDTKKWYLEIPDSMIGRLFTAITRLSRTPANFQFPHQEMAEGMYSLTLSPDHKTLFLKDASEVIDADTLDAISKAVDISNSLPIVAALKVDTCRDGVYRVDVSSLLLSEHFMTLHKDIKTSYQLSMPDPQRTYVNSVHSYPLNIEISTTRTYPSGRYRDGFVTVGLNTSLVLLPRTPMQRRLWDPRMAVNTISATHFSDNQQQVEKLQMVTRWRLEPKDSADAQRQKNGELIEPRKPVVYYIDPSFPAKWVPYIKEGVGEWERAFEHAGWKRAIYALDWPTSDSTITMEDARYNVIRFVPNDNRFVMGSNRAWDYRSGEFLNTFIYFFQGALQNMRNDYVGQCGNVDPQSHSAVFPDSLMGALIRHAIARAVAPTIGLAENLLASSFTPTDSLRSKTYLRRYSMAPSITDGLPYNYVAQPEDGLTRDELIPRVSDGDDWTVMLAYKNFGFTDPESEQFFLTRMLTDSIKANPRLEYTPTPFNDPLCKIDDLGDDQPKAIAYGLKNIKAIAPYIADWGATVKDFTYSDLNQQNYWAQINSQVIKMYVILANNFTGRCERTLPAGVEGRRYFHTSKEYFNKCLDMLIEMFKEQPKWMVPENSHRFSFATPERAGIGCASYIAQEGSANRQHYYNPNADGKEVLDRIYKVCFQQSAPGQAPDLYNRLLQNMFTVSMINSIPGSGNSYSTEQGGYACLHLLRQMQPRLKQCLSAAPDRLTRHHYQMLVKLTDDALKIE